MTAEELVRRHMSGVARELDAARATPEEREAVAQYVCLRLAERELQAAAEAFFEAADRVEFARRDLDRRVDAFVAYLREHARSRATEPADPAIDW